MTPEAIHQFVPTLAPRDAIGSHALQVQALLRDMGFASEIFTGEARGELVSRARPYRRFGWRRDRRRSWLLYQSSIGSPVADYLVRRPEPKIVNFHNVTPAALLEVWDPEVARNAVLAHHQLAGLSPTTAVAIAVSHVNRAELADMGFRSTVVAPPLIDIHSGSRDVDAATAERLAAGRRRGGADLLFVGRIAPHKAQHDAIKALVAYRRTYDARARLHLVGGCASSAYLLALRRFVSAQGLGEAVNIAGSVSDAQLAAYYASADVFVCCSEHEGFCVPMLEAMHHRLPIVAYGAAAVPETIGGAGVVLPSKGPALVAAAVQRVIDDRGLRSSLAEAGCSRLEDLSLPRSRARFAAVIEKAVTLDASVGERATEP